jgi:hypothetical protein
MEKAMHTPKEARKPQVLLIVQMDFGENMSKFYIGITNSLAVFFYA